MFQLRALFSVRWPFCLSSVFASCLCIVGGWSLLYCEKECVLVVQGLGVQLTRIYWSGARRHTFLEHSSIKDVIINEGFTTCRVIFYLAFVVAGRSSMVLTFQVVCCVALCCVE